MRILKIGTYALAISTILHIMWAIGSPNGILFYENNIYIKIIELIVSFGAIVFLLMEMKEEVKGR